ncbi:MAG: NTP transferase domain-containing protein [Longimicrobiales bacterium]|nr:NTP transferase domain-containing protein [Longimicrobiales bacterium]
MKQAGSRADRLLGAVLAGGAGRRFGGDKTAAEVGGVSMIRRAAGALEEVCQEVVVVSSRDGTPEGPWRRVPDLRPGRGPLAGMEAALTEAGRLWPDSASAVFVLAADLPLVGPETAARLAEAYRAGEAEVWAVAAGARPGEVGTRRPPGLDYEPLCAIYDVRCLEAATRLLDQDRSAARELFTEVRGTVVEVGDAETFLNVNTREDAERVRGILAHRAGGILAEGVEGILRERSGAMPGRGEGES